MSNWGCEDSGKVSNPSRGGDGGGNSTRKGGVCARNKGPERFVVVGMNCIVEYLPVM